mgnify:CR=1 FL=1
MSRQNWRPGNMLYPLPAVMVTANDPKNNIHQLYDGLSYLGGNHVERNEAFYIPENESIEEIDEILDENDSIPTENFLEIHKECNLNFYGINKKLTEIIVKSIQEKKKNKENNGL